MSDNTGPGRGSSCQFHPGSRAEHKSVGTFGNTLHTRVVPFWRADPPAHVDIRARRSVSALIRAMSRASAFPQTAKLIFGVPKIDSRH
jgi:hypothetical protein